MRQLTICAVLASALAASSAQAASGVATGDVNLRADPSARAHKLTTIPEGAAVEIHGCPTWCKVTYRGQTGWASAKYIGVVSVSSHGASSYDGVFPRIYYRGRPPFYYDIPFHRTARSWRENRPVYGPTVYLYEDF